MTSNVRNNVNLRTLHPPLAAVGGNDINGVSWRKPKEVTMMPMDTMLLYGIYITLWIAIAVIIIVVRR